jgi:hypothetical protein
VDNSLSLLNCKALLLSVATSCNVALVAFEKEKPDKTRVCKLYTKKEQIVSFVCYNYELKSNLEG